MVTGNKSYHIGFPRLPSRGRASGTGTHSDPRAPESTYPATARLNKIISHSHHALQTSSIKNPGGGYPWSNFLSFLEFLSGRIHERQSGRRASAGGKGRRGSTRRPRPRGGGGGGRGRRRPPPATHTPSSPPSSSAGGRSNDGACCATSSRTWTRTASSSPLQQLGEPSPPPGLPHRHRRGGTRRPGLCACHPPLLLPPVLHPPLHLDLDRG